MNQVLARSLVFFTSASVLVIEILAVRLVAPYLGVSLEVFTGIIGVVLAGISLGAWLGGRAADRGDPRRLLGPLLVGGGVAALAAPLVIDLIGPSLVVGPPSIVFASLAGFFLPAALLSAIPPVVVKIQLASLDKTGRVVGSYSAIGTAGAILGTFVTGFVLIAAFPTRPIVAVVGIALAVCGLVMWSTRGSWTLMSVSVVLVIGLLGFDGPCQYETTYSCAVVEVDLIRESGRTLVLDGVRNSYVDIEDPSYLEFRYIRLIADVIETMSPDDALNMVSIGGGGFTLPGYLEHTRPGSTNLVLEIDSGLIDIGRVDLALSEAVEVVVADARVSLRNVPDRSAEVVIGDAYSGMSVPWHLTTVEYTNEIARVLTPGGVYAMNVIDYADLDFVKSAAATLVDIFTDVAVFAPPTYLAGEAGGNFILVAPVSPDDVASIETAIRSRGGSEVGITGDALAGFVGDASLLTDDYAPVDQMLGRP